jgi:hypothetical protein
VPVILAFLLPNGAASLVNNKIGKINQILMGANKTAHSHLVRTSSMGATLVSNISTRHDNGNHRIATSRAEVEKEIHRHGLSSRVSSSSSINKNNIRANINIKTGKSSVWTCCVMPSTSTAAALRCAIRWNGEHMGKLFFQKGMRPSSSPMSIVETAGTTNASRPSFFFAFGNRFGTRKA